MYTIASGMSLYHVDQGFQLEYFPYPSLTSEERKNARKQLKRVSLTSHSFLG